MPSLSTTGRTGVALIVASLVLGSSHPAAEADTDEPPRLDCAVNALFLLLELEGQPASFERITASFPASRDPRGYSMAEIAAAARSLGLPLEGYQLPQAATPLREPVIAYVKTASGGHFAVLRRVGSTGTMVQVIDPPSPPWIADYGRVFQARSWTGRVLLRRDPWTTRNASLLLGTAGLAVVGVALVRWRL